MQFFCLTKGLPELCCSILPARCRSPCRCFQRAAHARLLVALEMGQETKHVRIHHGTADLGFFHIFAALHGDLHFIVALQAVGDDDVAAGGIGVKPLT